MPLKSIKFDVNITNNIAKTTITQEYTNDYEEKFIEAEYFFPISDISCFMEFCAEFNNKKIYGKIKEKEEAKKEYDENK